MSKRRSPTINSSSEVASPSSLGSSWGIFSRRRKSSGVEPFPALESEGTAGTADSTSQVPKPALPSSSGVLPAFSHSQRHKLVENRDEGRSKKKQQQQQSQSDRADALWAEMQATLADVELSANKGAHFFGAKHNAALEELRNAQMALAQAWARGEESIGADNHADNKEARHRRGNSNDAIDVGEEAEAHHSDSSLSDCSPGASIKRGGDTVDADAEAARRRREANDRYFSKIQRNVVEVVEKLEGVAKAMGKVESESREIWSSESDLVSSDE